MPIIVSSFIKLFVCRFVGIVVLLAGWSAFSLACDTPVYRYAMYRWEPAPYEIYYFHGQPLDEEAEQIKKLVEAASRSEDKPANAFFVPVSLTDDPELKRVPPDVRKAWQDQEERQVPTYWVVTPHGRKLYQGTLDEATLQAMWDSPARTDIAQQLAEGKAGVLVMLSGSDAAANETAEKVAQELITEVAAGKVELYLPPSMAVADDDDATSRLQLGLVKIAHTDPAEKWLIDSLMSLEDDLKNDEFATQPMIFAVFGRGRALPPFIGKGITRDNLLECVYFLTGACSCTVKDQNPGMDLLFAEDWWSVAENLASTFGAEEGNEAQLGADQLFPNLMIPGGQQVVDASAEPAGAVEGPSEAMASAPAAAAAVESKEQADEPPVAGTPVDTEKASAAVEPEVTAEPAVPPTAVEPAATEQTHRGSVHGADPPQAAAADAIGVFAVGAGLCVALVLLFGVTFLVMRPK